MIFVGDDWAEEHHDVYLMDEAGRAAGLAAAARGTDRHPPAARADRARMLEEPDQVVIGIETDRGLWVGALTAAGYQVYAVNPLAVARYRDRHHVSGAKSDASDAKLLADLVRTDRHNHRPIAGDSADAEAIKVLARAHQSLIWARTRHTNALRSRCASTTRPRWRPSRTWPTAMRWGCSIAPPPPSRALIWPCRRSSPRSNAVGANAISPPAPARSRPRCGTEQLAAPAPVTAAFARHHPRHGGHHRRTEPPDRELETSLAEHFETHPDADIYLSLPGLGVVLGARVLGEFGDDPNRYTDAKSRKNYAGTSPLTVASGKKRAVLARHVRNRRLYDAIDHWAFCALTDQPRRPQRSTTSTAPPATPTTKPYAPSATASSASCTAAYATTPPTTNTPPGHTACQRPLDNLRTWDVYICCCAPGTSDMSRPKPLDREAQFL